MKTLIITPLLLCIGLASASLAQDSAVDIPQVSSAPNPQAQEGAAMATPRKNPENKKDFQQNVLSNPTISDIARVNSLTNGGGNTSEVIQNGTPASQEQNQTDQNTPNTQN